MTKPYKDLRDDLVDRLGDEELLRQALRRLRRREVAMRWLTWGFVLALVVLTVWLVVSNAHADVININNGGR